MVRLIISRCLMAFASVMAVTALITTIIFFTPVDPARMSFGQRSDEETISLFRKKYYLDRPFYVQVWKYFEDLMPIQWLSRGDIRLDDYRYRELIEGDHGLFILKLPHLRKSYYNGKSVSDLISEALPGTLILAMSSIMLSILIGISAGLAAGLHQDSPLDKFIVASGAALYAIPSYVSALVLGLVFAFLLGDRTHLPLQGSLWDFDDLGDEKIYFGHLVLPAIALGLRPVSMIAQMTRAAVLDVLGSDYIRTARAKGISQWKLIRSHVLPNSMNPVITTISSWFASLLTGSFFVEYIFNYRGLGLLTISALQHFDIPVITGCCIATVIIFVTISLLTDMTYGFFDPRIRIN